MALAFNASASWAIGLEMNGSPSEPLKPIGTYGMGVSPKVGFKTILPADFKVYVHQKAKLPEAIDWTVEDTWVSALEKVTRNRDLSILVDWNSKSVMVRTGEVAVEESATRQEIAQAAKTPLPKFNPAKQSAPTAPPTQVAEAPKEVAAAELPVKEAVQTPLTVVPPNTTQSAVSGPADKVEPTQVGALTVVEPVAPASSAPANVIQSAVLTTLLSEPSTAVPMKPTVLGEVQAAKDKDIASSSSIATSPVTDKIIPALRTNPTPDMVAFQKTQASIAPVTLTSNGDFNYITATAYNKPSVRKVLKAIGAKYNMRVVWAVSQDISLKGPVTLLANDFNQDIELLKKAMGRGQPLTIEASAAEGVIRVYRPGTSSALIALAEADEVQPVSSKVVLATSVEQISTETPVSIKARANLKLVVYINQPLEDALSKFAREQGYTLDWQIEGGFEAGRELTYEAESLMQVLAKVLPPNGLSADIYTREKHIIIRPGDTRN